MMTPKRARKHIPLREQLAAALSMLLPAPLRDELREQKAPARTVIALFSPDHNILFALGGPDKWWNLTPMLREPHKEKSRRDTSIVAKVKRVAPEHEDFRRRMLKPDKGRVTRDKTSRFPRGQKLQSRNDLRRKS